MMDSKQNYAEKMRNLINSPENMEKAGDMLQKLTGRKIFIYGAGNAGSMTFKLLQQRRLEVDGFFDRRGGNGLVHCGRPVYKADDHQLSSRGGKGSMIIIAFMCGYRELEDMQHHLLDMGWESIYYFQTVNYFFDLYNCLDCTTQDLLASSKSPVSPKSEKIFEVAALMEDRESLAVFENFFKAVISGNPEFFSRPSEQPQYFVEDIPFRRGYARFIDCGAFDGDTASALKRYKGEAGALAAFEPDMDNFKKLCAGLKKERAAREQVLFPCGVWKDSQMLQFRSGFKSASGIADDGDTYIQCIAIDDAIADFAPTFIKMDIEGAEYQALEGARRTIRRYAPDLAISVYHCLEHLWQIPLLIKSIRADYRFYLRSHGLHGMETILYAVAE